MSRKKHASVAATVARCEEGKSLERQVRDALRAKLAIGCSKIEDRREGVDTYGRIYSYSTYNNYLAECRLYARWCAERHGCSRLDECRGHRDEYVREQIEAGKAASTVKKRAAALGKLYGDHYGAKVETPARSRENIVRSRDTVGMDAHFSEARHADLVEFLRSTGLRRHELRSLRGEQLRERGGRLWVVGVKGKGGKVRDVPVVGDEANVRRMMARPGQVFARGAVPKSCDVHAYRAEYAARYYRELARDPHELPRDQRYCCQGDRAGTWYDREAMRQVSAALGHNRVEVIASNYLYDV